MTLDRRSLAQLAHAARDDDSAWYSLVEHLAPTLRACLEKLGVHRDHHEHVTRATWRALSRRLQLHHPPADVADWLRDRAAIEADRIVSLRRRAAGGTAPAWSPLPPGLPERRAGGERRHHRRGSADRRRPGERTWSPDTLAAMRRRESAP